MESYLHMVADYPEAYEGQPGFDFLQKVPTSWDETRVLQADIGNALTIARRKGADWYVGTINSSTARTIKITADFLGDGSYQCEQYADATDDVPDHLVKKTVDIKRGDTLDLNIAAGGGQVMHFSRK